MESLEEVAAQLTQSGKGLLASDESVGTIGKRLNKASIANTEDARRDYRELFYTADIGESYAGVIMHKETLYQSSSSGKPFVQCLGDQEVLAGIKVDEGLVPLEGSDQETTTAGLDTLQQRCQEYARVRQASDTGSPCRQGATFAKWRAALRVGPQLPSSCAVEANAEQLAQYAAVCQATGLVPIVEPELLIDGDHSTERSAEAAQQVLAACISHLWRQGVHLEACLLKPQMVIPGADRQGPKPAPEEVAATTLRVMRRMVPPAIPGIMFLSGGQTEEEATVNLNAINLAAQQGSAPWALSFSFGRALQASVLNIWSEDRSKVAEAKAMAAALARANSQAVLGQYKGPHPSRGSSTDLREAFRGWSGGQGK